MKEVNGNTVRRYFAGLAEHTFQTQLGVVDPVLTDYISDMLTRFIRSDAMFHVRNVAGKRVSEVAEMMVEAQARVGDAKREVHRNIGDFTLFWTGVYPEAISRLKKDSRCDGLIDYQTEGKRSYFIVGTMQENNGSPKDDQNDQEDCSAVEQSVFIRLSEQFELCAYGLREVRRLWELGEGENQPRPFLL
ncbi:hypothetical protein ACFL2H_05520 [Planctomycetota bacterium]